MLLPQSPNPPKLPSSLFTPFLVSLFDFSHLVAPKAAPPRVQNKVCVGVCYLARQAVERRRKEEQRRREEQGLVAEEPSYSGSGGYSGSGEY